MIAHKNITDYVKQDNILQAFKLSCEELNFNLAKYLLLLRYDQHIHHTSDKLVYHIKNNNYKSIIRFVNNKYDHLDLNHFFMFGCLNGYTNTIKWLIDCYQCIDIDYEFGLCCACLNGHVNIISLMRKKYKFLNLNAYNDAPFSLACLNGHLNVAKYICDAVPIICYYAFNNEVFYNACITNKINVVKWYCKYGVSESMIINGLKYACENNNLIVLKYLSSLSNNIFHNNIIDLIISTCKNNNYMVLKWLLFYKPYIDPLNKKILLFTICKNCSVRILKLIMSYYTFDLSVDDETPFRYAAWFGKLDIIKYLLKCKPDINIGIHDNIVFKLVCLRNKVKIAKFFTTLNSNKYYVNATDSTIISHRIIYDKYVLNDDIINCLVCYDEKSTIVTSCNHQYCKNCIMTWSSDNLTCPYCRTLIGNYYNIVEKID